MKLYVMRHGLTDWNLNNKIQGQKDIELNEIGIKQAKDTKKIFNSYNFDLIISSPLKRTRQTTEIINQDKNTKIVYDDALIERFLGDYEGLCTEIEEDLIYNYNLNLKENNIEPVVKLCERVFQLLNYIKENYKSEKILLVTHSGTARAIEAYFYGIGEDGDLPPENLKNCEIREYTFRD